MPHNDCNMKFWAFWNTNLSIYNTVYLLLIRSYLPLSAQFFILRVVASTSFFQSVYQCVGAGILFAKFWLVGQIFRVTWQCVWLRSVGYFIIHLIFNYYFQSIWGFINSSIFILMLFELTRLLINLTFDTSFGISLFLIFGTSIEL